MATRCCSRPRGAKVVVADYGVDLDGSGSSSEPAEQVVKEIEAEGGEAVAVSADVSDEKAAATIVQSALDAFGRLDVLVNNAGIAAPLDTIENLTPANYRKMIEVHFLGTVYVTKAAWPHLVEGGYGRVVNTTSEAALGTVPKNTSYGSAKGAVLSYTRALAIDGLRHGIHVNAVAPRADTRMATPDILAHVYDAPEESFGASTAHFKPELVSPPAVYLAHESCRLNGEILVSGGGQVMRVRDHGERGHHQRRAHPRGGRGADRRHHGHEHGAAHRRGCGARRLRVETRR